MDNRARRMVNSCTIVPPFNPHDTPEVRKRCNDGKYCKLTFIL